MRRQRCQAKPVQNLGDKTGQSIVEYAALIAIVVAVLIAMQIYIKRGISGRLRAASDDIGEQYEPKKTTSDFTIRLFSNRMEKVRTEERGTLGNVTISESDIIQEKTTREGSETIGELGTDLWR